jgi:ABC-type antimicrobial peptide transport system permease subunit
MALGANRSDAVTLILRGAFRLIACGIAVGMPLAFAAGQFLGSQLYGVNPFNSLVALVAIAALGLSALIAALVPALRTRRISPVEALRA